MKTIEVDDELYRYIASHTLHIGESASDILRRMLKFSAVSQPATLVSKAAPTLAPAPVAEVKPANPVKDKVRAMREMLLSDEYAEQKRAVNRFMLVLTTLYSWTVKHLPRPPSLCTAARAFTSRKMRVRC